VSTETRDYETLEDRALDALVAERVMGWVPWLEQRGKYTHVVWQRKPNAEPWKESHRDYWQPERYTRITSPDIQPGKHITHYVGEDWRPSTDPAAAFTVLEAMRERGYGYTIEGHVAPYVKIWRPGAENARPGTSFRDIAFARAAVIEALRGLDEFEVAG
jgi:hypothetical protein